MTQDNWQDCPTFQSVAEAKKRGDEIETNHGHADVFSPWGGSVWEKQWKFRCRPAKPKTKTVVFKEYVVRFSFPPVWFIVECEAERVEDIYPGQKYKATGNERTEEVPE